MKKYIKNIIVFLTIIFCNIFFIPTANALSNFVDVRDIGNFKSDNLKLENVKFNVVSNDVNLTGNLINETDNIKYYYVTISFYDKNYNFISTYTVGDNALVGESDFNLVYNFEDYVYSINDIYYYKLSLRDNGNIVVHETDYINSSYDYVIDKYDIDIVVNEDNTFDITENISAYFNVSKHGIFRTIPLKNTINRLDGSTSKNRARVSNVSVNDNYSTSREDGNYKIKIGSPNRTLTGSKDYTIKYTYSIGKDPIKDYDELYYNLIGTEWDTVISNVNFTITMPKDFDSSKLGFSSGKIGSTSNSNIEYNVSGKVITGKYNGVFKPGEALTVRCELEDGYFVKAKFKFDKSFLLMFIVPLVSLLISILMWYKFGKDEMVVDTVEFYPPEGFNSLEIGFLYKGKVDYKDVTSLLIYLANKGYIKISETEEESLFSTDKGFIITKLKEYDGNDKNERLFLKGLFNKKSLNFHQLRVALEKKKNKDNNSHLEEESNSLESVTAIDLQNNFYIVMNEIVNNINSKENKNKIFEKGSFVRSFALILLMFLSLATIIAVPTLEYAGVGELGMTLGICAFYIPFYAAGIFAPFPSKFIKIFWLGFTIVHSFFFFSTLPIMEAFKDNISYLFGVLFGIACIVGMIVCLKYLPKRNKYGNEILGKIKGFRTFLETVEKEKLEAMVMDNPTYFYDILPYTYVLGVSDKWIEKFESISMQAPNWYYGYSDFNVVSFGSFMNSTISSVSSAMSSSPSSSSGSSGGSSSGGGSSGGGSGGGGGGSW